MAAKLPTERQYWLLRAMAYPDAAFVRSRGRVWYADDKTWSEPFRGAAFNSALDRNWLKRRSDLTYYITETGKQAFNAYSQQVRHEAVTFDDLLRRNTPNQFLSEQGQPDAAGMQYLIHHLTDEVRWLLASSQQEPTKWLDTHGQELLNQTRLYLAQLAQVT